MKNKWKKRIALTLVVCMFAMSAMGCGSSPAASDEANASAKLNAPEPISDDGTASSTQPNEADEVENSGTDDADANAETETKDSADNSENISGASGKWQVYDSDVAAAIDADFEGSVYEINANSFSILPIETTLLEDGSLLTVETAPDAEVSGEDLVQVSFDDSTVFTLRDIYDGGDRYEDSDASYGNVEKEVTVSLKGEFENDIFHASAVRIIKVH